MKANEFEAQLPTMTGLNKIEAEDSFGDFSELTGKPYKKQCNLVVRCPTLVFRIRPS